MGAGMTVRYHRIDRLTVDQRPWKSGRIFPRRVVQKPQPSFFFGKLAGSGRVFRWFIVFGIC